MSLVSTVKHDGFVFFLFFYWLSVDGRMDVGGSLSNRRNVGVRFSLFDFVFHIKSSFHQCYPQC